MMNGPYEWEREIEINLPFLFAPVLLRKIPIRKAPGRTGY